MSSDSKLTPSSASASTNTKSSKSEYQNRELEETIAANKNTKELDLSQRKLIDADMSMVAHHLLQGNKVGDILFSHSRLQQKFRSNVFLTYYRH